jgi:hypothetical protein
MKPSSIILPYLASTVIASSESYSAIDIQHLLIFNHQNGEISQYQQSQPGLWHRPLAPQNLQKHPNLPATLLSNMTL